MTDPDSPEVSAGVTPWPAAQRVYHWPGPPELTVERRTGETGRPQHRLVAQRGVDGVVVIARHEGQVLLVRQHRSVVGADVWELPRGFGEPADEAGAQALVAGAVRELAEEVGLELLDGQSYGRWWPDTGLLAGAVGVVVGRVGHRTPAQPTDGEVAATRWVHEADLDALVADGVIRDGLSLAALLLWRTRAPAAGG